MGTVVIGHFINYPQNVNSFRNDMWKFILASLKSSNFYGGDIIELTSLFYTLLQRFFLKSSLQSNKFAIGNLYPPTNIDVSDNLDVFFLFSSFSPHLCVTF